MPHVVPPIIRPYKLLQRTAQLNSNRKLLCLARLSGYWAKNIPRTKAWIVLGLWLRSYETLQRSFTFPAEVSHLCDRGGSWWCWMWRNRYHGKVSGYPAGIGATLSHPVLINWRYHSFGQRLTISLFNAISCLWALLALHKPYCLKDHPPPLVLLTWGKNTDHTEHVSSSILLPPSPWTEWILTANW